MATTRDYKAEYKKRIERGQARGLSPRQISGHYRPSDTKLNERVKEDTPDTLFERAITLIRKQTLTQSQAAKEVGVSPKKLDAFIKEKGILTEKQTVTKVVRGKDNQEKTVRTRQRVITSDPRIRQMDTFTNGKREKVRMSYDMSRKNGSYTNDVKNAIAKNDPGILDKWKGETITDVNGNIIPFETDLSKLKKFKGKKSANPYKIE